MNPLNRFASFSPIQIMMGSLFLAGVYYITFYDAGFNLENQISNAQAQFSELETKSKSLDRDLAEIAMLKATQERDAERLKVLLDYIPEKLNSVGLMQIVSTEAKAVGVNINKISAENTISGGEFYEEIPVLIDVSGSFVQFLRLLSGMTRLEQIFSFSNLKISRTGDGSDRASLTMTTLLKGYKYKGEAKGPKK